MKTEQLIIIDVECTCWENKITPPGQLSEIIEIGVCRLHLTQLTLSGRRSLLIKPARSQVSAFCTQLTSITPEMVAEGMSFAEACAILQNEYDTQEYGWGSWGNYDRGMFEQLCPLFGVPYPFGNQHINLKKAFTRCFRLPTDVGMSRGLRIAKLELEGTHHRGGDDAFNIARLTQAMINRCGPSFLTG
jgi:inhibitor of KinA sporulation pathway (predicted exonuclease)